MAKITEEVLKKFLSQATFDPRLRVHIFPEEWKELVELAQRGLAIAPGAPSPQDRVERLLSVVFRPLLTQGVLGTTDQGATILVDSESTREQQAITVWHEVLHLLLVALGVKDHDETAIEEAAKRLAAAMPEIVDWVRRG